MTELINTLDESFNFNDSTIRVIGTYDKPLFVAKDICDILGLSNVSEALRNIPDKWKSSETLRTTYNSQNMNVILEPGLYKLIMRSNKPVAQKFQEVVCEEILPSLRKKGEYKIQSIIDKNKKLELENKISLDTISKLNKKLEKKQRTKYELTHCVYIISNPSFKGYFKIGKSSSINNRLNSYATGAPTGYNVDYLCKVSSKGEETTIENMVLQILRTFRVKNHMDQEREWLYGVNLETIKNVMDMCIKFINDSRQQYDIKKEEEENEEEDNNDVENEENNDIENSNEEDNEVENNENEIEYIVEDEEIIEEKNNKVDGKTVKIKKKSKYDIENLDIVSKNNPSDFDKFILDCCEIGENFHVIQSDLKLAFKIWGRTPLDLIEKKFMKYMNENYKDTRIFIDNQRRHVFKGISLKPLRYEKTSYNFDFEEFIEKECNFDYLYKISYNDFFYYFIEWKKITDPSFKLNKYDKINIKSVLETFFCKGRVLNSTQSKTKNLTGLLGIGLNQNNYGLFEKKRQNKIVKEYDVITNNIVKEYESIAACANELKIPFSTFGNYLRNQTVFNGKYYKL